MIYATNNETLQPYLELPFTYSFLHGPHVVSSPEQALSRGISCVALVHFALRDLFGAELPPDLLFTEMYFDAQRFKPVQVNTMQAGDLFWVGKPNPLTPTAKFVPRYDTAGTELLNWNEMPVNHLGIYTGNNTRTGEPLILHASETEGTTALSTPRELAKHPRYAAHYGVSRLIVAGGV